MKTNKNKMYISVLIVFFITVLPCALPAQTGAKNTNEKYVIEPVFNTKAYIYDSGGKSKESVVLVHGLGDDASKIWSRLIPVLEKKYHVITFDLPGFGRSQKDNKLYSPKNYAAFVKWVADKYAGEKIYIVGHSMGGAISLYYAWMYPETVRRLVLVDAAGILHRAAFTKNIAKIEIEEIKNLPNPLDLFNYTIKTAIEKVDNKMPRDMSLVLENDLLRKKVLGGEPQKIASMALIQTNFCEQAYNIKTPVSIIWGGIDPIAPLRTGKMLSFLIPGTVLNVMPGLGHNPMLESPDKFNNLILDNLAGTQEDKNKAVKEDVKIPEAYGPITLEGKDGLTLTGAYESIKLINCKNIVITNADTGLIETQNSWVEIENTRIKSDDIGLNAADSVIAVTGAVITAGTAISASNSKIDLAGVRFQCTKTAATSTSAYKTTIVFSICDITSPGRNGFTHDIVSLGEGENF